MFLHVPAEFGHWVPTEKPFAESKELPANSKLLKVAGVGVMLVPLAPSAEVRLRFVEVRRRALVRISKAKISGFVSFPFALEAFMRR